MGLWLGACRRLACAAALMLAAAPAMAGEPGGGGGQVDGGAGRLEFVWPTPVEYDARVVFGRLLVRFSAPGDFDFAHYRGTMAQYLGDPTVVADGTVVAFPLKLPVAVRHARDGTRISIELVDEQGLATLPAGAGEGAESAAEPAAGAVAESAPTDLLAPPQFEPQAEAESQPVSQAAPQGEPVAESVAEPAAEPLAEAPAAQAFADPPALETAAGPATDPEAGEPIGLRVGDHPGFSRLVFDWPSRVPYRIEQRGRRVVIDFEAAAALDLAIFRRRQPANVDELSTESRPTGLSVTLNLPDELLVRHFRDGTHLVVDVVHDREAARLPPSTIVSEVEPLPDGAAAPGDATLGDAATGDGPAVADAVSPPDPAPLAPVTEGPLSTSGEAAPNRTWMAGQPQFTTIEPGMPPADASEPEADGMAQDGTVQDGMAQDGMAQDGTAPDGNAQDGAAPDAANAGTVPAGAGVLALVGRREADPADPASALAGSRRPVVLRFDWPSSAGAAAVFRRGRHLWIAFDQPLADGVGREIAEAVPDLAPVDRVTAEAGSPAAVLRVNLPWAFVPELRRADRTWILELKPRTDEPQAALRLEYLTDTSEPRIRFDVGGTAEVLRVRDPELGDLMEIVPVPVAGLGLERERRFLQFRALATYQGLAFIPLSDGLRVESEAGGVVVRDAAGLLISPGADRDRALRNSRDFESGQRPVDREARAREVAAVDAVRTLRGGAAGAGEVPADAPRAADTTLRRSALFAELFLGEAAARLSPPTAFALYREFAELTPAGPEGDRLIGRLADRLIEAGLLSPAARLLEVLVVHRLDGEEKVRAGTRLALLRLLSDEPVPALTALNASLPEGGFASLPAQLERDRRILRARSLASLGRGAEARALIDGDDSDEALRLEAELFWAEQNWAAAAGSLEKLAPPPGRDLPLTEAEGEMLLTLAAAYGLSGRREDVQGIAERYGPAMTDAAWRDAFASIAGTEGKAELIALGDKFAGPAGLEALEARYLAPSGSAPPAGAE